MYIDSESEWKRENPKLDFSIGPFAIGYELSQSRLISVSGSLLTRFRMDCQHSTLELRGYLLYVVSLVVNYFDKLLLYNVSCGKIFFMLFILYVCRTNCFSKRWPPPTLVCSSGFGRESLIQCTHLSWVLA